jgi:hypothetical protein
MLAGAWSRLTSGSSPAVSRRRSGSPPSGRSRCPTRKSGDKPTMMWTPAAAALRPRPGHPLFLRAWRREDESAASPDRQAASPLSVPGSLMKGRGHTVLAVSGNQCAGDHERQSTR